LVASRLRAKGSSTRVLDGGHLGVHSYRHGGVIGQLAQGEAGAVE